jgi:pSer/pThr/pTyr-binding forkhead associated (FHA) protein
VAVHCPECAFLNADGANYCSKCGAFLGSGTPEGDSATTATYRVGETGELIAIDLEEVVEDQGAALVIRAGGGRVGESFPVRGERLSIGRRPDCDIFLDDVTVSRDHALLVGRGDAFHIDDLGSLNGTYVNRARIDSQKLGDGDEIQIGKYKLTFLSR